MIFFIRMSKIVYNNFFNLSSLPYSFTAKPIEIVFLYQLFIFDFLRWLFQVSVRKQAHRSSHVYDGSLFLHSFIIW